MSAIWLGQQVPDPAISADPGRTSPGRARAETGGGGLAWFMHRWTALQRRRENQLACRPFGTVAGIATLAMGGHGKSAASQMYSHEGRWATTWPKSCSSRPTPRPHRPGARRPPRRLTRRCPTPGSGRWTCPSESGGHAHPGRGRARRTPRPRSGTGDDGRSAGRQCAGTRWAARRPGLWSPHREQDRSRPGRTGRGPGPAGRWQLACLRRPSKARSRRGSRLPPGRRPHRRWRSARPRMTQVRRT